ncbi:MAG: helix-turn-helix domain-containing protein [Planctomycetota bacterium]|nr:helix-turn-helix domain-containing protein [Planctomycetota bacterium]
MRHEAPAAPALERGLAVLDALATGFRDGASAEQLRERLGVPRASLYRVLKVLEVRRLVAQDARSGLYRLGRRTLELGYLARQSVPLVRAVQPLLSQLAQATHQMSEVCVAVGRWELLMLDVWLAEGTPVEVSARAGLLFGLNHQVAHGLVYLAFDAGRRVEEYIRLAARPEGRSALRVERAAPADLFEQLERARRRGWAALTYTGHKPRRTRISVPVFDPRTPGRLAAALGLVCAATAYTPLRAAAWAAELRAKARELELAL